MKKTILIIIISLITGALFAEEKHNQEENFPGNIMFGITVNKYGGGALDLAYVFPSDSDHVHPMGSTFSGFIIEDKLFQRYNSIGIGYADYDRLLAFDIGYSIKLAYMNVWEGRKGMIAAGYYGVDFDITFFSVAVDVGIFYPVDKDETSLLYLGIGFKF